MTYNFIFHTSFGCSAVLYSKDPFRITEILLLCPDKKAVLKKTKGCNVNSGDTDSRVLSVAKSIQDYFLGKIKFFPQDFYEWMNLENITDLEKKVLLATASIPYGKTASYGDIAKAVGRQRACRFVGNTLAKNPFPVLVPCHRVIKSDGSCGGFGGGRDLKMRMLSLERH